MPGNLVILPPEYAYRLKDRPADNGSRFWHLPDPERSMLSLCGRVLDVSQQVHLTEHTWPAQNEMCGCCFAFQEGAPPLRVKHVFTSFQAPATCQYGMVDRQQLCMGFPKSHIVLGDYFWKNVAKFDTNQGSEPAYKQFLHHDDLIMSPLDHVSMRWVQNPPDSLLPPRGIWVYRVRELYRSRVTPALLFAVHRLNRRAWCTGTLNRIAHQEVMETHLKYNVAMADAQRLFDTIEQAGKLREMYARQLELMDELLTSCCGEFLAGRSIKKCPDGP